MNRSSRPIGVFDSGIGGLTVVSELMALLPKENIVYFGDTARVPYGSKSPEAVTRFSLEIAGFLQKKNIKMLVVACNTATAHALPVLKKNLKIPVVGVIDPGARSAAETTKNSRIGVIGTEGTVASGSYAKAIGNISASFKVFQQACPLFVPLVEEGWLESAVTRQVASVYLAPLLKKNIDTLVLGCTHYPLLKKVIGIVAGKKITLIDSAVATALQVRHELSEHGLLHKGLARGRGRFFVSDSTEKFKSIGKRFMGDRITSVAKVSLSRHC
jgi:glutamate racemase